jgi:phosphate transport system substrate-binding protein
MQSDFGFVTAALLVGVSLSAALFAPTISNPALAQSVTLRSSDGSLTISGPLLRFDGNTYTIKTGAQGELNFAISDFSCISDSCPGPNAFGIHGSNTIGAELMPRLIEAYARLHGEYVRISNGASPEVTEIKVVGGDGKNRATIDLQAHGSGTATPGLASGKALIGMASRPLNEDELAQLAQHGLGDMRSPENERVVGLDGIVVIVSPANPVTEMSLQQVQAIFSGAVSDWSEVGGKPGKINVYARDAKSGTFDTFKTLVLDPGKQQIVGTAQRFESSNELSDRVANDAAGIGFIGFAYLRNAKAISLVNECGMSFTPSTFDVKTEEYPLSRRLFLYSGKLPAHSYAIGLLDFAMSLDAQAIIRDSGFIGQELEGWTEGQLRRMADVRSVRQQKGGSGLSFVTLAADLRETSRISTTMRFRYNSIELDNKALKDIDILTEFLRFIQAAKSTRKLVLVGFTDSVGTVDKNIALSLERANVARQALLRKLRDPQFAKLIEIRGYGPALPVACNENEAGRDKNRRVEVWLR